jgi:hypothetical protein
MSKRKHSALEDDSRPEGANDFRATRLRHRFERGTQLLFRALKTARGFERQKLGRRQKTAGQDEDNKALERLGAEVQVLKVGTLNLGPLICGVTNGDSRALTWKKRHSGIYSNNCKRPNASPNHLNMLD